MIDSSKKVAHAVGGKTARACDSCIKKRARVYCAADDAFLCKACDSSVHSANQLAGRHERVRLNTASLKPSKDESATSISAVPSWHRGFTRKARTPRHAKSVNSHHKSQEAVRNPFPVVPEVGADDTSYEENEEHDHQLLYRVPIFDPVVAELLCTCSANNSNDQEEEEAKNTSTSSVVSMLPNYGTNTTHDDGGMNYSSSNGFLPSDMDLAEFAADVDSLLGRGLDDNERLGMEGLGLMDCGKEKECGRVVKLEQENEVTEGAIFMDACQAETEIDMIREPFVFNFEDYEEEEEEEEIKVGVAEMNIHSNGDDCEVEEDAKSSKKRKIFLRLDYDAVITAWDTQASPWTSALRPDFDSIFFPDCMGAELHYPFGDLNGVGVHSAVGDGGREARVSRYREKRRTRLFSKKIRYEVRKLNAEKRPRMKGRFVKRSSFAGSSANFPMLAK